jgi:HK97 family phage major capsid protein
MGVVVSKILKPALKRNGENQMNLLDLKQQHKAALDKAEALLGASDHVMTVAENENYTNAMAEANNVAATIKARENMSTIRAAFPNGHPVVENREEAVSGRPAWQSSNYRKAFAAFLSSRGRNVSADLGLGADEMGGFKFAGISAAAYETSSTSGAVIVPSLVEQQIIALAPPEMGIEKLSTVIPTSFDLKFPRKIAHGTAAVKAEGTGNGTNVFTGTDPQNEQVTLSAGMIGHPEDASWELLQDVSVFQSFMTEDILLSLAILKENFYVNGGGSITGLKGHVGTGTGVGVAAVSSSYGAPLLDATFDILGTLNAVYHQNAAFLMARATSILIRKAQKQANLFEPVFVRSGGVDYLHGYPVEYSTAVDPATAATDVPLYFGSFKAGYMIGVRGGAGVNVKILDQPKALEGLLTVLGYQRIGAIIRRSEAIQSIVLA